VYTRARGKRAALSLQKRVSTFHTQTLRQRGVRCRQ
jgi:hypothetical protein